MASTQPSVLFVCLGNICRSPLGEGVLRSIAPENFIIDSAGTGDWHLGYPPDHRSIQVAKKHDVDISSLRARLIEANDFIKFDYIVCMDDSNYDNVIKMKPEHSGSKIIKFMDLLPESKYKIVPDPYHDESQEIVEFETVYQLMKEGCPLLLKQILNN